MNKVGIYFAYWTKDWAADYKKYIKKVSEIGFDILEIASGSLFGMTKAQMLDISKCAADQGIELTFCEGFTKEFDIASENETFRRNGIEHGKKICEFMDTMGVKIFGGINYSCWPGTINEELDDKRPYLERSINGVREISKTAEDFGVYYCLEVVNRFEQYLLNTAKEGIEFVDQVGSPNVKLLLDTYHMNIEEDNIGDAIRSAGDKLGHLHIGENNRKVPGRGHIPWDEIAKALKDIEYKNRVVMEPFLKMGGEVGRDIKVFRDLSNGMDEAEMDKEAKFALDFIRNKLQGA